MPKVKKTFQSTLPNNLPFLSKEEYNTAIIKELDAYKEFYTQSDSKKWCLEFLEFNNMLLDKMPKLKAMNEKYFGSYGFMIKMNKNNANIVLEDIVGKLEALCDIKETNKQKAKKAKVEVSSDDVLNRIDELLDAYFAEGNTKRFQFRVSQFAQKLETLPKTIQKQVKLYIKKLDFQFQTDEAIGKEEGIKQYKYKPSTLIALFNKSLGL